MIEISSVRTRVVVCSIPIHNPLLVIMIQWLGSWHTIVSIHHIAADSCLFPLQMVMDTQQWPLSNSRSSILSVWTWAMTVSQNKNQFVISEDKMRMNWQVKMNYHKWWAQQKQGNGKCIRSQTSLIIWVTRATSQPELIEHCRMLDLILLSLRSTWYVGDSINFTSV